ncbi:MAG TPA: hypothetical protein VHZ24_06795 [Pirellulales bacterium]|nr:hypothetical protein [Pirellulales bacterium]
MLDALVQAGLVDRHATHRFVIHDWHDHADESVKKTIAKHKITFASLDEPGAIDPPRDPTDQPKIENGSGSFENGSGSFENVPEQSPTESACLSLSPCLSLSHSSSSPKLRFDDQDMELAKWMFERVRTINPNHKAPSFDDWANDIRLMRERDGADRTLAGIRELFTWANADSFWQSNILSPAKLRKQWDQLTAKRKTNGKQQHNAGSDSPARVRQRDWSNVESIRGGSANGPAQPATAAGL